MRKVRTIRNANLKRKVERVIRGRQSNEYKMDKLRALQTAHPDVNIITIELDSEGTTPFLLACVLGNDALAAQLFDPAMSPLNRDHYLHPCYARAILAARANIPVASVASVIPLASMVATAPVMATGVPSVWEEEGVMQAVALVGRLTTSELRRAAEEAALIGGRRKTKKRLRQRSFFV